MSTQRYNYHWLPQYLEPEHWQKEDFWCTKVTFNSTCNITVILIFVAKPNVMQCYKESHPVYFP